MVQRTEVVRAAEQRARHVMETADDDSRRLRLETEDFLDQRLGQLRDPARPALEDRRRRAPEAVDRRPPAAGADRPTRTTRPRDSSTRTDDRGVRRWQTRALRINASELLRQPGSHRRRRAVDPARRARRRRRRASTGDVDGAVDLESTIDGIVVGGMASRRGGRTRVGGACGRSRVSPSPTSTSCTRTTSPTPTRSRSRAISSISLRWPASWSCSSCRDAPLCRDDCAGHLRRCAAATATSSRATATTPSATSAGRSSTSSIVDAETRLLSAVETARGFIWSRQFGISSR